MLSFGAILIGLTLLPFNPTTDRGVFVYGYLALDFARGIEVAGMQRSLRNCSDEDYFCADGVVFNIVLPRSCGSIGPTTTWRLGELETTVIGRQGGWRANTVRHGLPSDETYYLHTNVRPDVVFAYSPLGGVMTIYYDPRGRTDFVTMARDGELDRFTTSAIGDPQRDALTMELITLDTFSECRRPAAS